MTGGGGPGPGGAGRLRAIRRPRQSILLKILLALVANLLVATAVTSLVSAHLTRSALRQQADALTRSHLDVLSRAYADRERTLVATVRNLSQDLSGRGLTHPSRRLDLISELGAAADKLELGVLEVLDPSGRKLQPPAAAGTSLVDSPLRLADGPWLEPATGLLPTATGPFVQTVITRVGSGADRMILVGGYLFDDAFAYSLRKQLGTLDHVILTVDRKVVGTTLPHPPAAAPVPPGERGLPETPKTVRIAGEEMLVAYTAANYSPPPALRGALGVVVRDPVAPLDRALARNRVAVNALLAGVALVLGWLLFRAVTLRLVTLERTARRIARGDLDAEFDARGGDEIASLGRSLEWMRRELRSQTARLQESSKRIVAAQDEERHRMARDLHDGLQQQLVVLRMALGMARDAAQKDPFSAGRLLAELGAELDHVIERLREVTQDLYPSILVDRGLTSALRSYLGRLPLSTRLSCSPDPLPRLAPEVESAAYFLLCEAVTNGVKHSGAPEIRISLALDHSVLTVEVADDGVGFEPESRTHRGGLLHMEDRVRSFGGDLRIESSPGGGARVVALFPANLEPSEGGNGSRARGSGAPASHAPLAVAPSAALAGGEIRPA